MLKSCAGRERLFGNELKIQIHNVKEHFKSFKAKTVLDLKNKTFNCPEGSRPRNHWISWMDNHESYHHGVNKSLAVWKLV